jgi:hypothetical protein
VTLAINKNPQWNPEFKLNDKDLTPADKRETHHPIFCQHYKYSEGCACIFIDINLKDVVADFWQVVETMSSIKT